MVNLDKDTLYRLDLFVKHVENTLSKINSIKEQLNSNSLLYKLVETLPMHQFYVSNFTKLLNGEINWIPPKYTQCDFGKIYYSIDKNYIAKTYGEGAAFLFQRIGDIHMSFHKTVEECLKCQDNYEFKTLIIELASKSSLLVKTVLELLETIPKH